MLYLIYLINTMLNIQRGQYKKQFMTIIALNMPHIELLANHFNIHCDRLLHLIDDLWCHHQSHLVRLSLMLQEWYLHQTPIDLCPEVRKLPSWMHLHNIKYWKMILYKDWTDVDE